jgi:ketosteroid isomerase-like protein
MAKALNLVRSICDSWSRGDYTSIEWAHPDIEWSFGPDGPSPESGKGRTGMAKAWRAILSVWEGYRHVADEYREVDDERVLVFHHMAGRGKTSGLELEEVAARGALLFQVRGDKVTRLVGYFDRDRAFAELGLASERDKNS